jgi:PPK2 family polyphosphate:nucleotide phosphotransferase
MVDMNSTDYSKRLLVEEGKKVRLKDHYTGPVGRPEKDGSGKELEKNVEKMFRLQHLMYAEDKHAVLIVLQGMDTAGKDSTIQHVMRGLNPQGCGVTSFKAPTPEELDHDFLWRVHAVVPRIGEFGIFNRSHYEDVVMPRVHKTASKEVLEKRYRQINEFEEMLYENGTIILKFFLHISKEEQKKRLLERINDPAKNWKMNPADLKERALWDKYMEAYEEAINKCSKPHAPWYVIPSRHKWLRNLAVSQIIVDKLESLDMEYPKAGYKEKDLVID